MEEIKDYAIILIYPDGEVEKIPITTYPYHSAYFIDHLDKSKRFKNTLCGISLIGCTHYNISRILAINGVIEIANKDICIKIKNPEYYKSFSPEMYFFLPEYLGGLEQLKQLETIEKLILKEKIIVKGYNDNILNFEDRTFNDYEIWKENNRNRLESEIPKL